MGFATDAVPVKLGCEAVVADWVAAHKTRVGEEKLSPSPHPSESAQPGSSSFGWSKSSFRNQNELLVSLSIY